MSTLQRPASIRPLSAGCQQRGMGEGAGVERLEDRCFLAAHTLDESAPLPSGAWWEFAATADGRSATARATVVQASTAGIKLRVDVDSGFISASETFTYLRDARGLCFGGRLIDSDGEGVSVTFTPPVCLVPPVFRDGERYTVNSRITGEVLPDGPSFGGAVTGEVRIVGREMLTTPAREFDTVHIRIDLHMSLTAQGESAVIDAAQDWWLTDRIGFVRMDSTLTQTDSEGSDTSESSLVLTDSSLLRAQPDIDVSGGGVAIAAGDRTPGAGDGTLLEATPAGGRSGVRTFLVRNTAGTRRLDFDGVTITGAGARHFTIVSFPSEAMLRSGGVARLKVRFTPEGPGMKKATIRIESNDFDEPAFTFRIAGEALPAPELEVRGNGRAIPAGDVTPGIADRTSFGRALALGGARSQSFTIHNLGTADLVFAGDVAAAVAGPDAASFGIVTMPAGVVSAGGSTVLRVRFAPAARGHHTALIRLFTNDPAAPVFEFTVFGLGR